MWEPEPGWQPLRHGSGPATHSVWLAQVSDRAVVVKRLVAPVDGDAPELSDPQHYAWWRREVEVALMPGPCSRAGLVPPEVVRVDEDDAGATVMSAHVGAEKLPGPFLVRALGRFAAQEPPAVPWLCSDLLRDRLRRLERQEGWPTLARTNIADVAASLWQRRHGMLERYDALRHGPSHGDATVSNLLARRGEDVLAVDWQMTGTAPLGADLGYLALSCREDFDVLLDAWLEGHRAGGGDADAAEVRYAAQVMAVFTALTQAEWALSRVARGEGPLAAKFGHPAVAPHLRTLQRQFPHLRALVEG